MSATSFRDRCRHYGWIVGLPGLALILGVALPVATPIIESRLDSAAGTVARATAEAGAEPWLRFEARGRDLVVIGEAPDSSLRETAYRQLVALPGLRRLDGPVGLVEEASPFVWTATRTNPERVDLTGNRPAFLGPGALAERLTPVLPPEARLRDRARAALGAPPDFAVAAAYALATLKDLLPGGAVTLTDTRLSLRGEAASVESEVALRATLGTPPTGYVIGTVEIQPALVEDFRFGIGRATGGALRFTGYVVSEAARADLRARAAEASEGTGIADETRTARGLAADIDPKSLTRFTLQLAALLQDGRVDFAEGKVAVSGVALDGQAVGEIEGLMREDRPAGIAAGPVALETRPLSPYRVSIRREADSVVIGGHLPDEKTRERLLAALRPRFFRERIVDRSRMARGAPADLAPALEAAIGSLALLARGDIRVADRDIGLTGESLYAQSARRIEVDLPRAVPAGWRAETTVSVPGAVQPLDPEVCRAQFAARSGHSVLQFSPGSGTLRADFYAVLDGLAAWAKMCPVGQIEVTGHGDPAGATAAAKPALDTAVESTASLDAKAGATSATETSSREAPGRDPQTKTSTTKPAKAPEARSTSDKSASAKSTSARSTSGKAEPKAASRPAASVEPEPDLARQRALTVVEYLLQTGLAPDRIAAAPPGSTRPASAGIGFALRS